MTLLCACWTVRWSSSVPPPCNIHCSNIIPGSPSQSQIIAFGSMRTHVRMVAVRSASYLYEHMFSPAHTSKLAQRALGALRVARSFLLLEDDYSVDWEVDQDERTRVSHPHRAPLRGGCAQRRAGQLPARPQACLSPVGGTHHCVSHTGHAAAMLTRGACDWRGARMRSTSASS